jgi:hypothetical protein
LLVEAVNEEERDELICVEGRLTPAVREAMLKKRRNR